MPSASAIKTQTPDRPSFQGLGEAEKRARMRQEWVAESRFQREFGADAKEFDCGPHATALRAQVLRLLAAKGIDTQDVPLKRLHEAVPQEMKDYNFNDGVNKISTLLYDVDAEFLDVYHAFLRECVARHFPYPFYFQATTTTRIHCPGGENANHYPRYHTDIGYGHPPQEINLWLPLTEPQGEQRHGFRRLSVEDSRDILNEFDYDFTPFIDKAVNDKTFNAACEARAPQVETPFGKFLAFDSRCIHSGEPLRSHTRASIDIRIIPVTDYASMELSCQGSGRRRMLYAPGEAYFPEASDKL